MEEIKGYDEWKLKPYENEPKFVCICDHCGDDIYEGEEVTYTKDETVVHSDCFFEYACDVLMKYCGPAEVE